MCDMSKRVIKFHAINHSQRYVTYQVCIELK